MGSKLRSRPPGEAGSVEGFISGAGTETRQEIPSVGTKPERWAGERYPWQAPAVRGDAYLSGEMPISQMAEVLVMDRTTLTRNLKPLEAQGLIAIRSGADRREKLVTLTTRGRAMVSKALPLWEQAQRRIIEGLGQGRFDSMLKDLSKAVSLAHA